MMLYAIEVSVLVVEASGGSSNSVGALIIGVDIEVVVVVVEIISIVCSKTEVVSW